MKKKLQVFVSSTYIDMQSERQAAVEAILRAGHIPAGMELFAAGDESQWETVRRWIDDSDVFMLILGGRYGSIEPKSNKSYTELEYEYASKKKKPFFAAGITETYLAAKVKATGTDAIEMVNGHLLNAFRETVTKKICRFFNDVNELKVIVFESLGNLERNKELAGWIHGSDVVDPKAILEEASRLQGENVSLRKQVEDMALAQARAENTANPKPITSTLSEDAKKLLVASRYNGQIFCVSTLEGFLIYAGNLDFAASQSHREEARWKSAIDELLVYHLIESMGPKGETFRMTKLGYEVADEIDPPTSATIDT